MNRRFTLLRILNQLYFCPDSEELNKEDVLFKKTTQSWFKDCVNSKWKSQIDRFAMKQYNMAEEEMNILQIVNMI